MNINNINFAQRENPAAGPGPGPGPSPGPGPAAGAAGPAPGPAGPGAARPSVPEDEDEDVDEEDPGAVPLDEERPSGPATRKELRAIERQARVENRKL